MASRTQLRVQQLTGSLADLVYSGSTSSAANPSTLSQDHLGAVLGSFAGAIGRISGKTGTGASAFTNQAAGVFSHGTIKLGGDGDELEIRESGGDITFDVTTADKDIVFTHNTTATGDNTEIFRIDGSAESILMASGKKIELGGTSTNISGDNTDVTIVGTNLNINAGIDTTNQDTIITLRDNREDSLSFDTNGQAGILKIDTRNSAEKVVARSLDVTNDLHVQGNFIVSGDASEIILTASNTVIQDAIIGLGVSGSEGYAPSNVDRGIIFAGGASHAKQPAFYYDASGTKFILGTVDVSPSSASFGNIDGENGEHDTLQLLKTEFAGTSDFVGLDSGNLTLQGSGIAIVKTTDDDSMIDIDPKSGTINFKANSTQYGTLLVTGNEMILSGGNGAGKGILIDSHAGKVTFREGNSATPIGILDANADGLLLSASAEKGGAITLDPNDGDVHFSSQGTKFAKMAKDGTGFELSTTSGNTSYKIAASGNGAAQIFAGGADGGMVKLGIGGDHILNMTASAGSVQIRAGSGANDQSDIIFTNESYGVELARFDTSAHTLALPRQNSTGNDAGAGLLSFDGTSGTDEAIYSDGDYLYLRSDGVNFRLPNAAASTDGFALVADGTTGNLTFAAVGSDAVVKSIRIITGSKGIPAGTNCSLASADITAGAAQTALVQSDDQGKSLDVFVNGQLLVSGAAGTIGANATRDYAIISSDALRFAFDLEADDVVQVVKR